MCIFFHERGNRPLPPPTDREGRSSPATGSKPASCIFSGHKTFSVDSHRFGSQQPCFWSHEAGCPLPGLLRQPSSVFFLSIFLGPFSASLLGPCHALGRGRNGPPPRRSVGGPEGRRRGIVPIPLLPDLKQRLLRMSHNRSVMAQFQVNCIIAFVAEGTPFPITPPSAHHPSRGCGQGFAGYQLNGTLPSCYLSIIFISLTMGIRIWAWGGAFFENMG